MRNRLRDCFASQFFVLNVYTVCFKKLVLYVKASVLNFIGNRMTEFLREFI